LTSIIFLIAFVLIPFIKTCNLNTYIVRLKEIKKIFI